MMPETSTNVPAPRMVVPTGCCPPFDPAPWDDRIVSWRNKPFVKLHVRSFLHVPLHMGKAVAEATRRIADAGATPAQPLMLAEDTSAWGIDLFLEVTRPVPDLPMATLSGTFRTRVFEGPFRDARMWCAEMQERVADRGETLLGLWYAYTTCPACAKAYGKNYVVLFAKIAP
jgi:hypothetical protein